MTPSSWVWSFFAWLSLPLLILLAAAIVWRKMYREFPLFFSYVSITCLIGVIRFVAYKDFSAKTYFYVYWWTDLVLLVASFSALYEIFLQRIFPVSSKVRFYRYLFPLAGVVILGLAFLTALQAPDKRATFLIVSRVYDFLRSVVIGFFVLLILLMGRLFSGYELSIASGFGIQAAVALTNAGLRTIKGYGPTVLDRFEPIAFDIACLIWLWSFMRPSEISSTSPAELEPQMLHQARKWEQAVKNFLTPDKH